MENQSSLKHLVLGIIGIIILVAIFLIARLETKPKTQAEPEPSQPVMTTSRAILETNKGTIVINLDTEGTPNTIGNFIKLAQSGFYDGTRFHRVIDGFMIQGGDPLSKDLSQKDLWGTGGPGYQFADELTQTNANVRGSISMANAGPNTNGSQFFINLADNSYLNPKHVVFGHVVEGMDIVDAIAKTPVDGRDRPVTDVVIQKVVIETK